MIKHSLELELLNACQEGNMRKIRSLLMNPNPKLNANIHYRNEYGYSALTYACRFGKLSLVKYLLNSPYLQENPNLLSVDNTNNNVLMWSIEHKSLLTYFLNNPIIEQNIDLFEMNKNNENVFMALCKHGQKEIIENLIINKHILVDEITQNWLLQKSKSHNDIYYHVLDIINKRDLYSDLNKDLDITKKINKQVKI